MVTFKNYCFPCTSTELLWFCIMKQLWLATCLLCDFSFILGNYFQVFIPLNNQMKDNKSACTIKEF